MKAHFDHEKLDVYQAAIRFAAWAGDLLETLPKSLASYDQLGKELLAPIVSMLVGLIRSTSSDRVHEEPAEYQVSYRRLAD